ncbi:MAG: SDR family NAD(P)-dependent oxidoreductase [Verrucomicrobiota bacterium]
MNSSIRPKHKISEFGLVIVTGGSSGIGKTIIERVMKLGSGAKVCNLSRQKPELFSNDSKHLHLECDLSRKADRERAIASLKQLIADSPELGPVLLVNNAGFGIYGDIQEQEPNAHLEVLEVNVSAVIELTTALIPEIIRLGGAVMNIASTTSFQACPSLATYGAAKAFVLNWTLALNDELKTTTVRAIAVCPGATRTNFFKRAGVNAETTPEKGFQTTNQVVDTAFKALAKGKAYVTSGLLNRIMVQISCRLPKTFGTSISGQIIRSHRRQTEGN